MNEYLEEAKKILEEALEQDLEDHICDILSMAYTRISTAQLEIKRLQEFEKLYDAFTGF